MNRPDVLLPLAFSVQKIKQRIEVSDIFDSDTLIEIEIPGQGQLLLAGPMAWQLPDGINCETTIRISASHKRWLRHWEGPLHMLRDATLPTIYVSQIQYDVLRGILRIVGWLAGLPETCTLWLFGAGLEIARAQTGLKRPDVHSHHCLLPLTCGFRITAAIDQRQCPLELRATDSQGKPMVLLSIPEPEEIKAVVGPVLPKFQTKAQAMSQGVLEGLIASESFRRRWQAGTAEGVPEDSVCLVAREAVARELARRLKPGDEIAIRLVDGDLVHCCPVDDPVLARRYLAQAHDELGFTRWLASVVHPGDTVIDGGVAYGVMSRKMARCGARVIAVEADPVSAARLRRTGIWAPPGSIELIEAALAAEHGEVCFASMGSTLAGSSKIIGDASSDSVDAFLREISSLGQISLGGDIAEGRSRREITKQDVQLRSVEAVTLDGLCEAYGLRDLKLLKLDIEGGELEALRGATDLLSGKFGRLPVIAFEYSNLFPTRGGKREEILSLLWERGFEIWRLANGKDKGGDLVAVTSVEEAPAHDNLIAYPPGMFPG